METIVPMMSTSSLTVCPSCKQRVDEEEITTCESCEKTMCHNCDIGSISQGFICNNC